MVVHVVVGGGSSGGGVAAGCLNCCWCWCGVGVCFYVTGFTRASVARVLLLSTNP